LAWLVGSSEAREAPGLLSFFGDIFYRVSELPSPRNAQKREIKIEKKIGFGLFVDLFCKSVSTRFFYKTFFCSAFELPSLRNTRNMR
jgi:hypothetical protein